MLRIFISIAFLLCATIVPAEDAKTLPLSVEHKKWLDEVHWIISDYERNAFLSLQKAEDQDRFIRAFWENRDPTPGSAKNEFKDEHDERFEHAGKFFGRDSTLPGWKTDRGKVYILLGKPEFITRGSMELQPMELWHYVGSQGYGLPSSLYLIFFRKNGVGPYRLYSPLYDGLRSLFEHRAEFELRSEEELFEYLRTSISPEIAHASLSYIPTEGGWYGFQGRETGSLSTEVVLAGLENARNYELTKRTYVEQILKDRPTVKVYYTIGPEGIRDGLYWSMAPNGYFYLDFAVEYEPDKLDMGQYEEEYYTSLALDGQIASADKVEIEQIKSTHEIKLNKAQFSSIRTLPFQLEGRKPIIPGKFGFTMIVVNNLTRQAVTFAHDIEIPNMSVDTVPYLTPPLPIRSVEEAPQNDKKVRPFQFGDKIYTPNIPARYSTKGNMQIYHQVVFPNQVHLEKGELSLHYIINKGTTIESEVVEPIAIPPAQLPGEVIDVRKDIPLIRLEYGSKKLVVELRQGQKVVCRSLPFSFSVQPEASPAVWKFSIALPDFESPYHETTLAQQLIRSNKSNQAVPLLEEALRTHPNSTPIRLQLMRTAIKAGEYTKAYKLGNPIEVENPRDKEVLWLMGWACYGMEKYEDSIRFFERLRLEGPETVEVLNMLADIYYRSNQPAKSLERLQQSLTLKPDQKEIIELKGKLESMQKDSGTK